MADITIIGTGNMARGLATRALAGGKTVQLLAREDKAKADALAAELGGQVTAGVVGDQLSGAIVIPAVYYDPAKDVVAKYGSAAPGPAVGAGRTPPHTALGQRPAAGVPVELRAQGGSGQLETHRLLRNCRFRA